MVIRCKEVGKHWFSVVIYHGEVNGFGSEAPRNSDVEMDVCLLVELREERRAGVV